MSIFATLAVVCAYSFATDNVQCSDYVIDHAYTMTEAQANTKTKDQEFYSLWGDEFMLQDWLAKYNIGESPQVIETIEFTTKQFNEDMIP
ncbi:hypothetical protein Kassivere_00112 [Pseudomonas phage vB_PpuM-Kassivere]